MMVKPLYASEYSREQSELVRRTTLYVATKLGDLLDEVVVVGGVVPSLLIPDESLPSGSDAHVGTKDLDLGLGLALLHEERYRNFTERLRQAEFRPDINENGNPTFQRWILDNAEDLKVQVDFLIPPSVNTEVGGKLKHLEEDFAAVITPGLHLAFADREEVSIEGRVFSGGKARRSLWVSGPGSFVLLKALAFGTRGENKDSYDLYFLLRNYGNGVEDIFKRIAPLLDDPDAQKAIDLIRRDFSEIDSIGPVAAARFLFKEMNDELQADFVGFVDELLKRCEKKFTS